MFGITKTAEEFNKTVYLIEDNSIKAMDYADYLTEYQSDECTSPRGLTARKHTRRAENYDEVSQMIFSKDFDELSDTEEDKVLEAMNFDEYYEIWSWGAAGNNPYRYDDELYTEEEAELYILQEFEKNMYNNVNPNAPMCFFSREEAEQNQ